MKTFIVALGASLLVATQCNAQSTVFKSYYVDIPCVAAWDSSQADSAVTTYKARLWGEPFLEFYLVEEPQPIQYGDYCSGTFDVATNVYTDIVNAGDDSFHVRLRRDADGRFVHEATTPRGAATTSMWVARNGENTVYLAGTIHILRHRDYPLPRAYDEAYAKSSALYFEIDMDNPQETGEALTQAQILRQLRDPQGRTLWDMLTPENYAALSNHMRLRGMDIEVASQWSVQMLVNYLVYWELRNHGGFSANGVDDHLANRAKQDFKGIHGLETSALHNDVLQSLDEGYENEIVEGLLEGVASREILNDVDDMVGVWRNGDTSAIYRNSIIPMRQYEYDDYLRVHANRNKAWLPQIEALLETAATEMIVVGMAHMAGDEGLVALLRARGYSVEKY